MAYSYNVPWLSNPYDTSQSRGGGMGYYRSMDEANRATRDETLRNYLMQLQGPTYQNMLAAGGSDAASRAYKQGRQQQASGMYARGLAQSGAAQQGQQQLTDQYAQGILQAMLAARGQEDQRKQGLLTNILGVGEGDLGYIAGIEQARTGQEQANRQENLNNLIHQLGMAKSGFTLGALGVGGAAGAVGGAAGGAAAQGMGTGSATIGSTGQTAAQLGAGGGWSGAGAGALGGLGWYGSITGLGTNPMTSIFTRPPAQQQSGFGYQPSGQGYSIMPEGYRYSG